MRPTQSNVFWLHDGPLDTSDGTDDDKRFLPRRDGVGWVVGEVLFAGLILVNKKRGNRVLGGAVACRGRGSVRE